MKISIIAIPEITPGKINIKDANLDAVDKITKAKKKTYVQLDVVAEADALNADAILVNKDSAADLILKDLEFIETRTSRAVDEAEKVLLEKIKKLLEAEQFVFKTEFSQQEKEKMSEYGLLTKKPMVIVEKQDLEDVNALLFRAMKEAGFTAFFTTGEKETRAWLIKAGSNAWEAAGAIHSDIQKGFIRAEIIALADFLSCGGETAAKQAGKQRLEQKEYIMQYGDLANFRFNK